ncbi:MAG: hypothetical protein IKR73_09485, partial [Oscillospiraceae bacterium]|nr:hypothetical protein [Oscillospiraceae bacterium]
NDTELANGGVWHTTPDQMAQITSDQIEYICEVDPALATEDKIKFKYVSLTLESCVQLNMLFTKETTEEVDVKCLKGSGEMHVEQEGKMLKVMISDIPAEDLGEPITILINDHMIIYTPMSYCRVACERSENEELKNLCKSLDIYRSAAVEYANYVRSLEEE